MSRKERIKAEICYVQDRAGHSRQRPDHRILAIREPLRQLPSGGQAQLPFPTQEFGAKGTCTLFGVATNRKVSGDRVIWWPRGRCGKSEEVHSVTESRSRAQPSLGAGLVSCRLRCLGPMRCGGR